jgi:hypothetical protein
MHTRTLSPVRVAILAFAGACVGCPANLEDPGRFALDGATSLDGPEGCGDITQTLFLPVCATAECHSTSAKQQSLDLQAPGVASRLVGVPSTEGAGLLIDPSMPSASWLYTKLTTSPPFGVRMPFNLPPLDDARIACVLQWVTAQVPVGEAGADDASDDAAEPPIDDGSTAAGGDGSSNDAAAPVRDAGGSKPDASQPPPKDASAPEAGPADAGRPTDAKAD